jgi:hypothetical protein
MLICEVSIAIRLNDELLVIPKTDGDQLRVLQKKSERMKDNKVSFESIDEYIATFSEETQKILEELRATIKAAAPDAEEKMALPTPAGKLS